MGCSSSSANTIEPANTNDVPQVAPTKGGDKVQGKKASSIGELSQSRAEGQAIKDGTTTVVVMDSNDSKQALGSDAHNIEASTVPSTPITMASRTLASTHDDITSPLPSPQPSSSSVAVAAASGNGNVLRPASATMTSSNSTSKGLTTPSRRVASAGSLRNPVLASLTSSSHMQTLSPIADVPNSPSSPPPSTISSRHDNNNNDSTGIAAVASISDANVPLAIVGGEKVALRAMAASHVATLTKKEVNRQPMFIPWEKPALGKSVAANTAGSSGGAADNDSKTNDTNMRPTTSGGRRAPAPAIPANLDRLMNKTHKPSKHKRERLAAAAAAAAAANGSSNEKKATNDGLIIVGAAINTTITSNDNNDNSNKENVSSSDDNSNGNNNGMNDEKKTKRPAPLKRRLAPLAPIKGTNGALPSSSLPSLSTPSVTAATASSSSSSRPTTSAGVRPGTSSGSNGASAETLAAMRRDRDRASLHQSVERLLMDTHILPLRVTSLILHLSSITASSGPTFELVKPKQPPAWEIRF